MEELEAEALDRLTKDHVPDDRRILQRIADCRYAGQGYELRVQVQSGQITENSISTIVEAFHQVHEKEFGRAFPENAVEIVNIRVVGIGKMSELTWQKVAQGGTDPGEALKYVKDVIYEIGDIAQKLSTSVYDRSALKAGNKIIGPAIIEQMDTTTLIEPGQEAVVDEYGNLIISI